MRGVVKRIVLALFLLGVAFAGFGACQGGLSSSAAQEKAGTILGSDASSANSLSQPLEVGSDSYWVFFFSIYSPTRMLVAVSDSTGEIVTDRDRLYRVGSAVYSYAVIEEFLKARGWGFDAVEPVLSSASGIISDDGRRLADFSSQTQGLYPALSPSFSKLDSALSKLSDQTLAAESTARDGSSLEATFASDYSASSLAAVFRQYNASLRSLETLFSAFDAYQKEISDFSFMLYKANVTASDASSINKNLDVLSDVGLSDLRNKFVSQKPRQEFARLLAASDRWVNDSIESALYRKNRREALDAVSELTPQMESLSANEADLVACGVSQNSLSKARKDWNDARYFLSKETAAGFARALEKADAVKAQLADIQRAYALCGSTATARPAAKPSADYSPALAFVLIIILAVGAYAYYKKKQEELEQFGPPQ
jgi:hypothetical protein